MSGSRSAGLRAVLRQLTTPPDTESDAALLHRVSTGRSTAGFVPDAEDAFAALMHRHGPMVLAVCRSRLANPSDADDAFQVAFLVLARDAERIHNPAAVAGWLYRVATLSALKLRSRMSRQGTSSLGDHEPASLADPIAAVESREIHRVIEDELAALPEKLRAVVVLCCLEDRTNTEAAQLLGCPTGTVDSRLATARKRLRERLARRGILAATVAIADYSLLRTASATLPVLPTLCESSLRTVSLFAATNGVSSHPLFSLVHGVTPAMTTTLSAKVLTIAGLTLAILTTAGLGLFPAPAGEKPNSVKPQLPDVKPTPPKAVGELKKPLLGGGGNPAPVGETSETMLREALTKPIDKLDLDKEITLKELLEVIHDRYGVVARLDMPAFVRWEWNSNDGTPPLQLYEQSVKFPITRGFTVGDVLAEAIAQLDGKLTYRIRGGQVLIGPAFIPPATPGSGAVGQLAEPQVPPQQLKEQILGEPVSVALDDQSFTKALQQLRKQTGANIVMDARCREKGDQVVSGSFHDVRLLTVLQVLSDMCDLRPVAMNNVYYITTPENAMKLQMDINRDLFGDDSIAPAEWRFGGRPGPGAIAPTPPSVPPQIPAK